jgi:hypothetical protein
MATLNKVVDAVARHTDFRPSYVRARVRRLREDGVLPTSVGRAAAHATSADISNVLLATLTATDGYANATKAAERYGSLRC